MKYLAVLLICIAVVYAADPARPKIPETFEATGEMHVIAANGTAIGVGRWAIDQPHGKGVKHFEFAEHQKHYTVLEVLRYDLSKEFTVQHGKCTVTPVKPPMPTAWQWILDAKYNGTVTIRNQICDVWVGQDGPSTKTVAVDSTNVNAPVFFEEKQTGVGSVQVHFWNFESHQANPDWFDIPEQCPHMAEHESLPVAFPHPPAKYEIISDEEAQQHIRRLQAMVQNATFPSEVCTKAAYCASVICGSCHCPYVYGGESNCCKTHKSGLDCSGLVQYSYVDCGGDSGMPRTTFEMYADLKEGCGNCSPGHTESCHVGDLFFYYPSAQGPDHVVMYIGNDRVAECPHTGEDCRILKPYTSPYVGCRRLC